MENISLTELNLEKNTQTKILEIGNQKIEVLSYLPAKYKEDLINVTVAESFIDGYVHPLRLQVNFNIFLMLSYTNIVLPENQNLYYAYDDLEKNGVFAEIVDSIPENEYSDLVELLEAYVEKREEKANSITSLVQGTLDRIEMSFNNMASNLQDVNLDTDNLQKILAIAKDNGALGQ